MKQIYILNTFGMGKNPTKHKFFMWLMENGALLTKYNLVKRNWVVSPE